MGQMGKVIGLLSFFFFFFFFEYATTGAGRSIPIEDCGLIYYVSLYLFLGNLLIIIIRNHCRLP